MDMPLVEKSKQNAPCFSPEIMSKLAALKYKRERMLFILCAAGGLRIGEALGLEIDKHISADFRTLDISQKVLLHSKVYKRLKTASAARPCIVPVPCVYSRLISSNSSTFVLLSIGHPVGEADKVPN
jgi:hypothetical protein